MLTRSNETLDAFDVPGAVTLWNRPSTSGPDIRASIRLSKHHRGTPLALDHDLGNTLITLVACCPQRVSELGPCRIEHCRWIGADIELVNSPLHRLRSGLPTELLR